MRFHFSAAVVALLLVTARPALAEEEKNKGTSSTLLVAGGLATFATAYGVRMAIGGDDANGVLWATPAVGGWLYGSVGLVVSAVPGYGGGELALLSVGLLALGSLEAGGIAMTIAGIMQARKNDPDANKPRPPAPWTVRPYVTGQSAGLTGTF